MRFHHARAEVETAKGSEADPAVIATELALAREAAKDAAPYLHPRLRDSKPSPTRAASG
jgi:hypothetical protein